MSEPTARDLISRMESVFVPENAEGVNKIIQFDLVGEGGGIWSACINDGACTIKEEPTEEADVTLKMEPEHFVSLVRGKLNPAMAFMGGKLKLRGDMMLAQKLSKYFNLKGLDT